MSKMGGVLAFLWLIIWGNPGFGEEKTMITLEELQWKNRIILVFLNKDADSEALRAEFKEHADEIDDRDIRFFLIGEPVKTNGSESLARAYVRQLRKRYNVNNDDRLTVVLIGKDGGEKYRKDRLDLEEIDRVIDAMPMRRQEMKRNHRS